MVSAVEWDGSSGLYVEKLLGREDRKGNVEVEHGPKSGANGRQ